jgi:hypothetical protein
MAACVVAIAGALIIALYAKMSFSPPELRQSMAASYELHGDTKLTKRNKLKEPLLDGGEAGGATVTVSTTTNLNGNGADDDEDENEVRPCEWSQPWISLASA